MSDRPDVIFCTRRFHEASRDRFEAIAPGIEVVTLDPDRDVGPDEIERITIGFFSADAWPGDAPRFMTVALGASNLRWFHTMSAGVDHPVFQAIMDGGAVLTNSTGTSAEPIASTAIMYLLALERDLPRMMRDQAARSWEWRTWNELAGRGIAVLGWGPIGQHVARLAEAHGMVPTIVRRAVRGDEGHPTRTLDELAEVVAENSAVVVALPHTEETRGLISAEILAAMPRGSFFVNVGRGELVDQDALVDALRSGHLGGAGLDVTVPEPLPEDDPLWTLPNVIITPHNSGSTDGSDRRAADVFFDNLARWTAGEELINRVNG